MIDISKLSSHYDVRRLTDGGQWAFDVTTDKT